MVVSLHSSHHGQLQTSESRPAWKLVLIYHIKDLSAENAKDDPTIMEGELRQLYRAPLSFCVSVLAVELTIHFNHIKGVHSLRSTSQLIPFVVGLGQLLFVVFQMLFGDTNIEELSFPSLGGKFTARLKLAFGDVDSDTD